MHIQKYFTKNTFLHIHLSLNLSHNTSFLSLDLFCQDTTLVLDTAVFEISYIQIDNISLLDWIQDVLTSLVLLINAHIVSHLGIIWLASSNIPLNNCTFVATTLANMLPSEWDVQYIQLNRVWFGDAMDAQQTIFYIQKHDIPFLVHNQPSFSTVPESIHHKISYLTIFHDTATTFSLQHNFTSSTYHFTTRHPRVIAALNNYLMTAL